MGAEYLHMQLHSYLAHAPTIQLLQQCPKELSDTQAHLTGLLPLLLLREALTDLEALLDADLHKYKSTISAWVQLTICDDN